MVSRAVLVVCFLVGVAGQARAVSANDPDKTHPHCPPVPDCSLTCPEAPDCNVTCPQPPDCSLTCPQTPFCEPSCENDVTTVFQYDPAANTCRKLAAYPCAPFRCDDEGKTCATSCTSYADCSEGAQCNTATGRCSAASPTCSDDFTLRNPDGTTQSCSPYRCLGGACQQQCESNNDCAEDYSCAGGVCVENP